MLLCPQCCESIIQVGAELSNCSPKICVFMSLCFFLCNELTTFSQLPLLIGVLDSEIGVQVTCSCRLGPQNSHAYSCTFFFSSRYQELRQLWQSQKPCVKDDSLFQTGSLNDYIENSLPVDCSLSRTVPRALNKLLLCGEFCCCCYRSQHYTYYYMHTTMQGFGSEIYKLKIESPSYPKYAPYCELCQ